jgi:tetratricopeptide (TPR) repeat protein
MSSQESLGDRVRSWRLRQGMSQAQLALPELSDSYVSLIESGKRTPAPEVVRLLARKLGCSASYLTSGVNDEIVDGLRTTVKYAQIALENGEAIEARARFADALAHPDLAVLPALEQEARWGHARALEATGQIDEAVVEMKRVALSIEPGAEQDRWANLHTALCRCYLEHGDVAESIRTGEEALSRLTSTGSRWTEEMVLLGVTVLGAYQERGDLAYADQLARKLMDRAESVGSPRAVMAALWNGAWVAESRGEAESALAMAERAIALLGEENDPRNLSRLRCAFGHFLLIAHPEEASRALKALRQAEGELAESSASSIDRGWCLVYQAQAQFILGESDSAAALAEQAIELLGDTAGLAKAEALTVLSEALVQLHRQDEAVDALIQAATLLEGMEASRPAGQVWYRLAELLGTAGESSRQTSALRQALVCMGL